jgi:hypothetical protein
MLNWQRKKDSTTWELQSSVSTGIPKNGSSYNISLQVPFPIEYYWRLYILTFEYFFPLCFNLSAFTVYYSVLVNSLARESDRGWWVQQRGSERLHHVKRSDGELSCKNNIASAGTPSNCVKVYRKLLTQFVRWWWISFFLFLPRPRSISSFLSLIIYVVNCTLELENLNSYTSRLISCQLLYLHKQSLGSRFWGIFYWQLLNCFGPQHEQCLWGKCMSCKVQ